MKVRNRVAGSWAACTLAVASLGLASTPALAQESAPPASSQSAAPSPQDLAVAERVRDTLLSDIAMQGIQLLVSVMNGTVELLGVARDQAQAERAVELTRTVPGVTDVVHYIEVDGVRPAANMV